MKSLSFINKKNMKKMNKKGRKMIYDGFSVSFLFFLVSYFIMLDFTRTIQSSRLLVSACNLFRYILILLYSVVRNVTF